jgi:hypothetical protein
LVTLVEEKMMSMALHQGMQLAMVWLLRGRGDDVSSSGGDRAKATMDPDAATIDI